MMNISTKFVRFNSIILLILVNSATQNGLAETQLAKERVKVEKRAVTSQPMPTPSNPPMLKMPEGSPPSAMLADREQGVVRKATNRLMPMPTEPSMLKMPKDASAFGMASDNQAPTASNATYTLRRVEKPRPIPLPLEPAPP